MMSNMQDNSITKPLAKLPKNGFIGKKELLIFLPFDGEKLFKLSKESLFPKPYTIDDNTVFYDCAEIHQWFYRQKEHRKILNTTETSIDLEKKTIAYFKITQPIIILKLNDISLNSIGIIKIFCRIIYWFMS